MKSFTATALFFAVVAAIPAHSAEFGEVVNGIKMPEFSVDFYADPDKWRSDGINNTTKQISKKFGLPKTVEEAAKVFLTAAHKEMADSIAYFSNARKMGAIKVATERLNAAANKGDVRAMHIKGVVATVNVEGDRDAKLAIRWLKKAADLNHAPSQFMLGFVYTGFAGDEYTDLAKMRVLMKRAADNGYAAGAAALIVDKADEPFRE